VRRGWLALFFLLSSMLRTSAEQAHADGAWLDDTPLVPWNAAGMPVPAAPLPPGLPPDAPQCGGGDRPPEIVEDSLIVQAGWVLFGSYEGGWGAKLLWGLTGYDGMCRPMGYQQFVFVDGVFAGTMSPVPMNSREDGSLASSHIGQDRLSAEFNRYTPSDPLCCPSSTTVVEYRIDRIDGNPVVTPVSSFSSPSQR
jgi:hypothetical protein